MRKIASTYELLDLQSWSWNELNSYLEDPLYLYFQARCSQIETVDIGKGSYLHDVPLTIITFPVDWPMLPFPKPSYLHFYLSL